MILTPEFTWISGEVCGGLEANELQPEQGESSAATSLGGLMFLSTGCYSAFLSCSGLTDCMFSLYFSKPWLYSALSGLSCTKNCIDGMKVSSEKKNQQNQPLRYDELAAISVVKMVSHSWLLTTLWWIHFHARDGLLFQRSLIETWSSYFQKFKVLLAVNPAVEFYSHVFYLLLLLCVYSGWALKEKWS